MAQNVPLSNRRHVSIFGETNAGKSALFNAILGQDFVIVSHESGTTTDPVVKAMELIPFGPIALTDTAGLGDGSALGNERMKKTRQILNRTDFAVYAADSGAFNAESYLSFCAELKQKKTPHLLVFTKSEVCSEEQLEFLKNNYPKAIFVSVFKEETVTALKSTLSQKLTELGEQEESMIADLVPAGGTVVLVCPIDSAAPKGRLILPQVQLIRDCLDNGIQCLVTKESELEGALTKLNKIDMVITDSQIFSFVSKLVPTEIPLTSFSLLMARQKGDLKEYLKGVDALAGLPDNANILLAEGCTHNTTHEDIGKVKIPAGLQKKAGKSFNFTFVSGHDFPEDLSAYDLVIHCGGCMLTRRAIMSRSEQCAAAKVPITNYGIALAYITGILDRCRTVFEQEENTD